MESYTAHFTDFLLYMAISAVGAVYLGGVAFVVESVSYKALTWLEHRGYLKRIVPEAKTTINKFQIETFWTFVYSTFPTLLFVCYVR